MIFGYLLALIPVSIGAIMWLCDRKIVWFEWLAGSILAFLTVAGMHWGMLKGMTNDYETWSGKIIHAVHYPYWEEHFTTIEFDSKGNSRIVHHFVDHPEYWVAETTVGDIKINHQQFNQIASSFGGEVYAKRISKPNFNSGDPNIYIAENVSDLVLPVTVWKTFENRLKAASTVFSFSKVPPNAPVFPYPKNENFMASDRLIGTAVNTIDLREFDLMNSRLGPRKKVNVIMIGFKSSDASIASWQEASWIGGRKNDLVLCYGTADDNTTQALWTRVFGWTEKEDCKRNLETILASSSIDTSILSKIEAEIARNYHIKDWHKFDYIAISPPSWFFPALVAVMIASQAAFWTWARKNSYGKHWPRFR